MITTERNTERRRPQWEWLHRWFGWKLARWPAYRRWFGGHWERWALDWPVNAVQWIDQPRGCSRLDLSARPKAGRGGPICEDYPVHF